MSIRRFFMDWNQPALPLAVEYFERHFLDHSSNTLNMDQVLVVVPGSRAGRRLSQLLALRAKERGEILFPPQIQTVGNLPEHLYESKRPFADELTQHLAWVESIRSQHVRAKKFFPHLPGDEDTVDWLDLAAMLARIHRELAADGLDFSDVVENGKSVRGFAESRRWRFLRALQEGYLNVLDDLDLWDMQTARLHAIKHLECQTDLQIFLLATVDLNQATRQMLKQVSNQVVTLIHAPESEALGFDDFGGLEPEYWEEKQIPIQSQDVIVTDQPADQADAVCYWLGQFPQPLDPQNVVVGVPANETALYIQRKLNELGVSSHWSVGRSLNASGPYRLLEALRAVLDMDGYPEFATLIRHPDIDAWLEQIAPADAAGFPTGASALDVIGESDAYYGKHLVPAFDDWLGHRKKRVSLQWGIETIQALIKPLQKKTLPLSQWAEPILAMVNQIYQHAELDYENRNDFFTIHALKKLRQALESLLDIPRPLDISTNAVDVIRLVLQKMGQESVAHRSEAPSVELLGWLELPLDLADHVILTSLNEGLIPESLNADMFLPNSMRTALGLVDNQRRYARDAYAVSSLVHSKKKLRIVIGKRNLAGDPLMPSRIFFATDRQTIANRVLQFSKPVEFSNPETAAKAQSESAFVVPYPELAGLQIQSINVTGFKAYLQCPYRFYLQHVLRLKQVDDSERELNALAFGTAFHEIFHRFGESRHRFSQDELEIADFLEMELEKYTAENLGQRHLPAVEIQLQQIRHRLKGFAQWQAGRTRDGWEIKYIEKKPLDPSGMDFDFEAGRSVKLRGSIDRIDYHQPSDTWQILDYKTGDRGDEPHRTHLEKGQWVDLQLPLYRLIARQFDVEGNVQLGYILIPKSISDIRVAIANWSDEQIEEAWQVARDCARRIVDLEFWEPVYPTPRYAGQEWAPLCQDRVFEPRLALPPESSVLSTPGGQE